MKITERIISITLLSIIFFSNLTTPVIYAAGEGDVQLVFTKPSTQSATLASPSALPQSGNVLGSSTSLLAVGAQSFSTQNSASKRVPIRMRALTKKVYQTDEPVTVSITNPDNTPLQTTVLNNKGQSVTVPMTQTSDGTTTDIQLQASNEIVPGKYTVKVTDQAGDATSQDFTWGVLALNTDKTMYHPGEKADIAMAVLDDKGSMVCDASVKLEITNTAAGIDDTLSTDASASADKQITVNPQCQQHDFSLEPDYEAHYQFDKGGNYQLQLTATTANGTHTITDIVPVTDNIPFDVQRISATRIFPPDTYPMTFNITANQDFKGTVTETVPQDFTITPATGSAQTNSYTNMQTMYLNGTNPTQQLAQAVLGSGTSALVMPFQGTYPVTQGFGAELTDPTLQAFYTHYGLSGHDGIDFGVPMNTQLFAVDDGNIIWSGPGDYGITVIIQHSWGESYYGHLSNTVVRVGDHVTKGQLIGYSGESGEATGPHLHFGMKPNNADMNNGYYGKIDPMPYLPYGHIGESTDAIGPQISLPSQASGAANLSSLDTVLGASTNAQPTLTPSPLATDAATASSSAVPTTTVTPTPQVSGDQTETATPAANENFSVLDKEIQTNEQLSNNSQTEKVKVITWQVSLKKGESTTLGYNFQAPQQSPQFYLLGPMQFYSGGSNKAIFQEQRSWELAADDVGVDWYIDATGIQFNGYSWQYRKKITIDHTKVSTATQTNFPVLIDITGDTNLQSHAQSNCNDVLFTDSTGRTLLNYEIEAVGATDCGSGNLVAWVNISSLSNTTDTIIYMYYGNPAATTHANVHATWNSSYMSVLHMAQTSGTVTDSTSNNNSASSIATSNITGQIGNGRSTTGTGTAPYSYLNISNSSTVDFGASQNFTISLWFKSTQAVNGSIFPEVFVKEDQPNTHGYGIAEDGSGNNELYGEIYTSAANHFVANSATNYNNGAWHYVAFERSGSTISIYVDGAFKTSSAASNASISNTADVGLGNVGNCGCGPIAASLDEAHILNTALTAGWITTEYNNQNSPTTFSTLANEETKIYAPALSALMRHGEFFNTQGEVQPFTF